MTDWTGQLNLQAEQRNGKTVAKNVYFQGAFKVMRPIYHDNSGQACYYVLNPGGGYLNGDRYQMKISLDNKAKLTLTTQSATKIYKTPSKEAYQESEFRLREGSYLEYIPDPLIGYEHARYKQKNVFRMEHGCTLFYSDIMTSGWSPSGEKFKYDRLQLINEIYIQDELKVYDHIKLSPATQNITGLGLMDGYSHLGSMLIVDDKVSADLLDRLYEAILSELSSCRVGLSMLPIPGIAVRILANSTQTIEKLISECHSILSQEWFNKKPSFLRKY